MDTTTIAAACKVLGHPDRLALLDLLAHPERFPDNLVDPTRVGICVNDLASAAGLPQSTASGHVTQLSRAGLVTVEKRGPWRYLRADRRALKQLSAQLQHLGSKPLVDD